MVESDTDRKNAQKVMINITIVKFAQITDYGTYCGILGYSKRHKIWQYGPKGFLNVVPDREKGGILRETGVTAEPD